MRSRVTVCKSLNTKAFNLKGLDTFGTRKEGRVSGPFESKEQQ